jgi:DNA-binding Lrp family transcriptional regulator
MDKDDLDDIDKKIIVLLRENARMSVANMAREIGELTENAIRYRIERLESEGFISKFTIRLDPKKFGKNLIAIFNFNIMPQHIKTALEYLKSMDCLTQIYLTTGDISIVTIGYFDDREALSLFITEKLRRIKIVDYNVTTVLNKTKHQLYSI